MSEATALMGTAAPGRTIVHNGKEFTFASALSHRSLARLEAWLYDRARSALADLRDMLPVGDYLKRVDELSKRYQEGYYTLHSEATMEFLQTPKGGIVLLMAITGADEGDLYDLLMNRSQEVEVVLKEIMDSTFPPTANGTPAGPKVRPRP